MKTKASITFDIEFESWMDGWNKLRRICKIIEETDIKGLGEFRSMGFG